MTVHIASADTGITWCTYVAIGQTFDEAVEAAASYGVGEHGTDADRLHGPEGQAGMREAAKEVYRALRSPAAIGGVDQAEPVGLAVRSPRGVHTGQLVFTLEMGESLSPPRIGVRAVS